MPQGRLFRLSKVIEWPTALLSPFVFVALIVEERATTPEVRTAGVILNWTIWLAFCAEFGIRWAADRTLSFPRRAWFDVILILISPPFGVPDALQGTRSLRIFRLLRLVRAFGVAGMGLRLAQRYFAERKFHYVVVLACATVLLGALGIHASEEGINPAIRGFGDAL